MNCEKIRYMLLLLAAAVSLQAAAVTLTEAKKLYAAGDYAAALPAFRTALKAKPADSSLNYLVGSCLYNTGKPAEAKGYLSAAMKKNDLDAFLCMARLSLDEYAPDAADDYIERYRAALKKSRAKNKKESDKVDPLEREIEKLRNMLSRVEKIVIIDSVAVDRDAFFEAYRLSPESGSFYSQLTLPDGFAGGGSMVYMPESQTSMMWSVMSDDGKALELVESSLLSDGSWEQPRSLGHVINEGGDADFPFLMTDGITLYFANNGENSMGGYDIFISRRGDDNTFLAPQNVGMPYNSPYDDYLLAIDEVTGVGWWATDRNQLGDQITIYKFIPADLRINYAPDTDGLAGFARVDSYKDTWEPGADYSALLEAVDNIESRYSAEEEHDFMLAFPDGRVYTRWDDFKSGAARSLMEQYVDAQAEAASDAQKLDGLRRQYASGRKSVSSQILELEKKAMAMRKSQKRIKNEIIRMER